MKSLIKTVLLAAALITGTAHAERVKDLASIAGVRVNQLVGYGIVVGLDGTGDLTTQTPFTVQSTLNMLGRLGVNLPPGTNLQLKNVAAVMVTANLPPFARPGQRIDVNVSSIGNAKSLRGGTLVLTPLKGANGQIYAMAQGNILLGGAGASSGGSSVQINSLASGRVPEGATVEQSVATQLASNGMLQLELRETDFTTASRLATSINRAYPGAFAQPLDGRVVQVRAPATAADRVRFLAGLEDLEVTPDQGRAKVVLNERTGSIVMNQNITLDPCAVAHGNLTVTIQSQPVISQPGPLSNGKTVVSQASDVNIDADKGHLLQLPAGARLRDVVKALNAIGATPQDLLAILQAMKAAGALHAELEVI